MEFKEVKLGEIVEIIGGGTPKTSVSEYWNGNIPWISIVDLGIEGKYIYKTEKSITESGLKNSSTKLLQKGELVISARGTVGKIKMLKRNMAFNQSCYGIRADSKKINSDYLYYAVTSSPTYTSNFCHKILGVEVGASFCTYSCKQSVLLR